MFNKNDTGSLKEVETIIGASVKIKGDFKSQGNIVVEGEVDGSLESKSKLLVKEKSRIVANIKAKEAIIGGDVVGNIEIEGALELTASAKINGDITASSLSIAKGAVFNGKCFMPYSAEKKELVSNDNRVASE